MVAYSQHCILERLRRGETDECRSHFLKAVFLPWATSLNESTPDVLQDAQEVAKGKGKKSLMVVVGS